MSSHRECGEQTRFPYRWQPGYNRVNLNTTTDTTDKIFIKVSRRFGLIGLIGMHGFQRRIGPWATGRKFRLTPGQIRISRRPESNVSTSTAALPEC
jgi:hypothetical protein